ncbi:ATP dependent DNA helicase [Gigaspora margarita]|uniref:ATP dependent DNA helicase n=1 Tax=Gigaspora margarita TaxID=4874 RepID=A0A8H3XDI4_GIGMA|nr:ATP dependent DNA helicase [Gigaspora margarita]
MILVNTEQYIISIYTQLCSNCSDFNYSNCNCTLSKSGFLVKCEIVYQKCNTITESSNQNENENLSKYVLAVALASGINQNALQFVLACIGITAQVDKTTYFDHQTHIFQLIINHAKQSTKNALNDIINYLLINANSNEIIYLLIRFNISWSHSRNDKQASVKFIFAQDLLEQLSIPLENSNILVNICVDGDLNTNKTLLDIKFINQIYADLKHLSKNIRKNLYMYFNKLKYILPVYANLISNSKTSSEKELAILQVNGLIQHLKDNYSLY